MSRRGSAQLLLLSSRRRRVLGWTIGVTATVALLAGVLHAGRDFPLLTQTGLAQMLRQSAWERALAELPQQAALPWVETSSEPTSSVPRLGLSASVLKTAGSEAHTDRTFKPIEPGPAKDPHLSQFDEVSIGDRITVTTANGASRVCQVTGPTVVDPHLAEAEPAAYDTAPEHCLPLDPQPVIQAGKVEQPAQPEPGPEHKL
jgi:hypothetical protein